MPHIVIEHSPKLSAVSSPILLCQAAFKACNEAGLFNSEDIKIRAIKYDDYILASADFEYEDSAQFVHITAHILAGRTMEQKCALTDRLYADVLPLLPASASLSVEVVEIENASYRKRNAIVDDN